MYEVKRNVLHKYKLVNGDVVVTVDQWGKLVCMSRPTGAAQRLDWGRVQSFFELHRRNWREITGKTVRFAPYSAAMRDYLQAAAVDLNGIEET